MTWLSVKEGLPRNGEPILAITDQGGFVVASIVDGMWELNKKAIGIITEYNCFAIIKGEITHWQPLPSALELLDQRNKTESVVMIESSLTF